MTAALIAAVAATAGIILGRLWDARSETARWRRDQKTASYQRLAEAYRRTLEGIRTVALTDPADERFIDLVQQVRADSTWDDAYTAVWLHGSPPVVQAAAALDHAETKLFYDAQEHRHRVEDWYRIRIPAHQAFEHFLEAAREELKLQPVAATFFPAIGRQTPPSPVSTPPAEEPEQKRSGTPTS
ncbi:hypothetical protein [Nocardia transvalensis]|uniref:hypothetical protein n=1 Tax=Nocardia transvalensis TaxID=37333 RepID=UPI00189364C7|nr:hypothetical protein [Nocardia transvalensis]MBF6333472.1 hypothetical protein [Nocardia transvalensis]